MPRDPKGQLVERELLTLPVWDQFDASTAESVVRAVERCLPEPWSFARVEWHECGGQRRHVALFDWNGTEFVLVPGAEEGLRLAHEFLTDTSATYREQADPRVRRRWNQIFFTKIYVTRRGIVGTELTDEFGALLADDLAAKLEKMPSDPARFRTRGSNSACLVEAGGIEPPTPACKAGVFPLAPRPRPRQW